MYIKKKKIIIILEILSFANEKNCQENNYKHNMIIQKNK